MEGWPKEPLLLTAPHNLHVTVFFLGFIYEDQLPEISSSVKEACREIPAFELRFTGMQLMDDEESPRMIWLAGEPSDELRNLRESVEKSFASFVTEKKVYRPHVTLAKIKKAKWLQSSNRPHLKKEMRLVEPIDRVVLYESAVIDGKRRYEEIDSFDLR